MPKCATRRHTGMAQKLGSRTLSSRRHRTRKSAARFLLGGNTCQYIRHSLIGGWPVQEIGDVAGYSISREQESRIEVYVTLRHASRRVPQQPGDCQFRKPEFAGDACKGMTEHMRSDTFEPCAVTHPRQHSDNAYEMAVSPIGGKDIGRVFADSLRLDHVKRCLADGAHLRPGFCVREPHTMFALAH